MQRSALFLASAVVALGTASSDAWAKQPKTGHKFKGSVEVQYRTNNNISVAPSSGERFDYAELSEFGIEDEEDLAADDAEEEDEDAADEGDDFADLIDVDPSEDEIEEDDAFDEDGDGIDDLLDPDEGGVVDSESRYTTKLGLGHKYTFAGGTTSWNNGLRFASDPH